MKSKAILTTSFILYSVLLYSCRVYIPNSGGDTPLSIDGVENTVTPTPTEIDQPTSEVTVTVRSTVLPETPACQTPTASVKINNVYLRDGPDLRFPGSIRYKNGEKFTVLGRYRDWFQAKAPTGNQGWLYKDWLTLPSNFDMNTICSIPLEKLPPTPPDGQQNNENNPQNGKECEPSYYDSCE